MKQIKIFTKSYALNKSSLNEPIPFYFLGADYKSQTSLNVRFPRLSGLGRLYHEMALTKQSIFQNFFFSINQKNNSEFYWTLPIATHSSAETPLYQQLIYILCAKQIIEKTDGPHGFICESYETAKALKNVALKLNIKVELQSSYGDKLAHLKTIPKLVYRSAFFLLRSLFLWLKVRRFKNVRLSSSTAQRYLLRTLLTPSSIDATKPYNDRHYGNLSKYLKEQGKEVWILPLFFNVDKNISTHLEVLSQKPESIIFLEQYVAFISYFRLLLKTLRNLKINLENIKIQDVDVTQLVKFYHYSSALAPELLSFNMHYELLKSLSKKNIDFQKIIYTYENITNEKTFLIAARKFYSQTQIIGFQHSVWYKEQLNMSLHPQDLSIVPMPDKIVTSGTRYVEILKNCGFPESMLHSGPNLRFDAIYSFKSELSIIGNREILIILNYDVNQCTELLTKVHAAFKTMKPCHVKIKSHPLLDKKYIHNFLTGIAFPTYQWVEGEVQPLIKKSDVVIMGGASVTNFEVIALGVPLLRVSLDSNFDFDPIWESDSMWDMLADPDTIANALEAAFDITLEQKKVLIELGNKMVQAYFEPVTDEKLKVFISQK